MLALREAESAVLATMSETVERLQQGARHACRRAARGQGGADTSEAAVWELVGRCLSSANAVILLLREGLIVQGDLLLRALWETTAVLATIATSEERDLRTRWLGVQSMANNATARPMERLTGSTRRRGWDSNHETPSRA